MMASNRKRPKPLLSVIIPTRNRNSRLRRTLELLTAQRSPELFEVVVVDNGSTDDTPQVIEDVKESSTLNIVGICQPKPGLGAASNAGIAAANGKWILRIGDDTEPASDSLFERHAELHSLADDPHFAVLGKVIWKDSDELSDFQRWLDFGGPQNHYQEIVAGRVSPRNYFYGSHHSASKEAFLGVGGFDERITYGYDDADIGLRLEAWGLELVYHPELVLLHDHPTTLSQSLARMERIGRAAALFNTIGPAGRHERIGDPGITKQHIARLIAPFLSCSSYVPLPLKLRRLVWKYAHLSRFIQGYAKGPPETL